MARQVIGEKEKQRRALREGVAARPSRARLRAAVNNALIGELTQSLPIAAASVLARSTKPKRATSARASNSVPVRDGVALMSAAHPVGKGRLRKREPFADSLVKMPAPPAVASMVKTAASVFKADADEIRRALRFYRNHRKRQKLAARARKARALAEA